MGLFFAVLGLFYVCFFGQNLGPFRVRLFIFWVRKNNWGHWERSVVQPSTEGNEEMGDCPVCRR